MRPESYYSDAPTIGEDGSLVQEFVTMEMIMSNSLDTNTYQDYVCRVKQNPMFECLDIAGASTLANLQGDNTLNSTYAESALGGVSTNVLALNTLAFDLATSSALALNASTTNLFGIDQTCDEKKVGDGVVNGFDIFVLLAYQFSLPPYDTLINVPGLVTTVRGRTDTKNRCEDDSNDALSRLEYQQAIAVDACVEDPNAERRRLTGGDTSTALAPSGSHLTSITQALAKFDETTFNGGRDILGNLQRHELNAKVYTYTETDMGSWYLINIPGVHVSLELTINGADTLKPIYLSNEAAPPFGDATFIPNVPSDYELRFKRHREYTGESTEQCAVIEATGLQSMAMYRGVITVSQFYSSDYKACGFDLYLWKPAVVVARSAVQTCPVALAAGSATMDGISGTVQKYTACSTMLRTSHLSPPPAAPTTNAISPPPPPETKKTSSRLLYWLFPFLLLMTALGICVFPRLRLWCMEFRAANVTSIKRVKVEAVAEAAAP